MRNQVYISLGTNIGEREQHLVKAIQLLRKNSKIKLTNISSIYETDPVGYTEQSRFLNMVVEIQTSYQPLELLTKTQEIEAKLGRVRDIRWGPRIIDLDILLYNQENSKMDRLIIPHPRMHERAFVLIPLNEIAPQLNIPPWNKRVVDFINELPETDVKDVRKWIPNA